MISCVNCIGPYQFYWLNHIFFLYIVSHHFLSSDIVHFRIRLGRLLAAVLMKKSNAYTLLMIFPNIYVHYITVMICFRHIRRLHIPAISRWPDWFVLNMMIALRKAFPDPKDRPGLPQGHGRFTSWYPAIYYQIHCYKVGIVLCSS